MSERKFECKRCGCCCVRPGWVFFSTPELDTICSGLSVDLDTLMPYFRGLETWVYEGKEDDLPDVLGFRMEAGCIFYEDGGCSIYPYRPKQCREYPFWGSISTDEEWEEESRKCEGIMIDTGSGD